MREIRYERGDRKHSAIILVCAILKISYLLQNPNSQENIHE